MFTRLELNTFCAVYFQIHYNLITLEVDRKSNIFCKHVSRDFVR